MAGQSNKVKHKTKTALNKVKSSIKEKLFNIADIQSTTVQELADFIQHHPETKVTKKEMLGNTYSFYNLETQGNKYYLETNTSKILQLDVSSQDKNMVSYRSYRDSYQMHTPIRIP
ncbi:hypothetical protein [Neobacillus terrae]|uniref:hypothetical protein n=1 Tax=Neobacillus terrae TaxID=3034837 RepID=UPI00140D55F2|nr:hypothetical protein [Neobacillus terrae]NHM32053.1 hypothetical protein [Neobacillus terrae]